MRSTILSYFVKIGLIYELLSWYKEAPKQIPYENSQSWFPVNTLTALYWTLPSVNHLKSQSWLFSQMTPQFSMSGLMTHKHVNMDLSTLYLPNLSKLNRIEAFSYILRGWFLNDILHCNIKVKPEWAWDSTSLATLESGNRGGGGVGFYYTW